MPNVRYSSGAIGTMRLPISGSFIQSLSRRTTAIVVAMEFLPEPCFSSAYILSPGSWRFLARTTRRGTEPPRLSRRSFMYWISGASSPGWKNGAAPVSS